MATLVISACSPHSRPAAGNTSGDGTPVASIEHWLALEGEVSAMETGDIVARLVKVNRPEGVGQLYYYGLLNHHLQTYGAWTLARDTFRKMLESDQLTAAQRQLVTVLKDYNQARINAYLQQQELLQQNLLLRDETAASQAMQAELEQKLRALTDLETDMSTRKEQD